VVRGYTLKQGDGSSASWLVIDYHKPQTRKSIMKNDNSIKVKPMESYHPPKVATLEDVYKNPEKLKTLPKRWAKNAAVVTCVGILGMSTLAGCFGEILSGGQYSGDNGETIHGEENITDVKNGENGNGYGNGSENRNGYGVTYNGYDEFDLVVRLHGGGSGWVGYVIHLTEQEALGIIRTQLEAAGLRFSDTPPNYTVFGDDTVWYPSVGLDLFDASNNVAVTHLNLSMSDVPFGPRGRGWAELIEEEFANQTGLNVGVFYTSSFHPRWDAMGIWFEDDEDEWIHIPPEEPTDKQITEAKSEARPILEEHLNNQIDRFIKHLQSIGIID